MKFYQSPETSVLQVNASTFLCGSETPGPTPEPTSVGVGINAMGRTGLTIQWI